MFTFLSAVLIISKFQNFGKLFPHSMQKMLEAKQTILESVIGKQFQTNPNPKMNNTFI